MYTDGASFRSYISLKLKHRYQIAIYLDAPQSRNCFFNVAVVLSILSLERAGASGK